MSEKDDILENSEPSQPIVLHGKIHGTESPGEYGSGPPTDRRVSGIPDRRVAPPRLSSLAATGLTPEIASDEAKRALSLDALRGLFLISMTFGFAIGEGLPPYMYHFQEPPSGFAEIPGISWRDLAYAAFLFTMAAAIPITLSRRLAKGAVELEILFAAIRRGLMLFVFALMVGHADMFFTGYSSTTQVLSIAGFVLLFGMYVRRRKDWNPERFRFVKLAAWASGAVFLVLSPWLYGRTFSIGRIDGIILDLAFASFAGMILWYLTRDNLLARLLVLALSIALYLGAKADGWVADIWWQAPVFKLNLMIVVIPGLIAGDALVRWMNSSATAEGTVIARWSSARNLTLTVLCFVITPLVTIGLYNRWVEQTAYATFAIVIAGFFLTRDAASADEKLLQKLFRWGSLWLVLGLLLEPFEGGITKVPETLTYFFTVTGLTSLLLAGMAAVFGLSPITKKARLLVDIGTNPLLAYVIFSMVLNPLLDLLPFTEPLLRGTPGQGLVRSIIVTFISVALVLVFTRKRIFLRA